MARSIIPEGWPDIWWIPAGEYDERLDYFENEYGFRPEEGQPEEEVEQRVIEEGGEIPPRPPRDICGLPEELRRERMQQLLHALENNDCEPCVEAIVAQIMELLKCQPSKELFEMASEVFNG